MTTFKTKYGWKDKIQNPLHRKFTSAHDICSKLSNLVNLWRIDKFIRSTSTLDEPQLAWLDLWLDSVSIDMLGKPIMMFRVNLINYLVKLHLKCINEYCIRISEILCIYSWWHKFMWCPTAPNVIAPSHVFSQHCTCLHYMDTAHEQPVPSYSLM